MFDLKGKHEHVFLSILNKYIFLCRKRPFDFFKEKGGCAGTDKDFVSHPRYFLRICKNDLLSFSV